MVYKLKKRYSRLGLSKKKILYVATNVEEYTKWLRKQNVFKIIQGAKLHVHVCKGENRPTPSSSTQGPLLKNNIFMRPVRLIYDNFICAATIYYTTTPPPPPGVINLQQPLHIQVQQRRYVDVAMTSVLRRCPTVRVLFSSPTGAVLSCHR